MSNRKPDGVTPLLSDREMRDLGFTDHREDHWYWCRKIDDNGYTTLNITIDKDSGFYEELVMDEMGGQPEYYGRMRAEFRDAVIRKVDEYVALLNKAGLCVAVDHKEYGCE